jgi:hypothetical protein
MPIIILLLFGFFLGKIVPIRGNGWRKWYYNRFGVPYYVCHLLDGGHIIKTSIVPQDAGKYKLEDGGIYTFKVKTGSGEYTPFVTFGGEMLIFHVKGNRNPLMIKDNDYKPGSDDPDRIAALIANKDVRDATHPQIEEIAALKRFILFMLIAVFGMTMAGFYIILTGLFGSG